MNAFSPSARGGQRASTLLMVMFAITVLAVYIGLAVDYTGNTGRIAKRARDYTAAQALANGALNATYKSWEEYMALHQASAIASYTTTANFAALATLVQTQINSAASPTGLRLSSLSITSVNRADVTESAQSTTYASIGPLTNVPGWNATTYTYKATAMVTKTSDATITLSVSRYFQQADASLFQAMLFFQDDLELSAGPPMTLYGLVHTNSNLYAAAGYNGSLTFDSDVSFHGNQSTLNPGPGYMYLDPNGYVEGVTQTLYNEEPGNWVTYNAPVYATSRSSQLSNVEELYPLGPDEISAVDPNNANASGTHEIIERPVPVSATNPSASPSVPDPATFQAHRIWNSAGLRILINRNNASQPVHVYVPQAGNPENSTEILPSASTPNIANQITSAITIDGGTGNIYDFREDSAINADTVDMSILTPRLNAYSAYNGIVYISDITNADANGNSGNTDAIRLEKGGVLPTQGLTVASDGAIYVQGDYNTGTTYGTTQSNGAIPLVNQPESNTGTDPTQFTVAGYTQVPASIMADAVNVLSNNWLDSNSSLAISSRKATATTFNAAIVSGQVLTTPTAESGGAHNFPRFLENWSGLNFTYHGSMVELYASTHFTGVFGQNGVYSPPNRLWYIDNSYLTSPPPGNLRATTYTAGRWVLNTNQ